ncbi:MAG: TetR/AcrR family transcriptional regulator [Deltaproteobacteria bacterium]|nr:TetR/AcrR family transcriptional regulator [Deltaproteobacteria bacterium]
MPRPSQFSHDQLIQAALHLVADHGPTAATIGAIAGRVGAPVGSIYHRFASRDALLAEAWLWAADIFRAGFLELLAGEDADAAGLGAALYTVHWARLYPVEARVLLLHPRKSLTEGEWPEALAERAEQGDRQLAEGLKAFAKRRFGRATDDGVERVTLAVLDVPAAAVRRHLDNGRKLTPAVDKVVSQAHAALLGR